MKMIKVVLGTGIVIYLAFAFIFLTLNPSTWHILGRLLFIAFWISFVCIIDMINEIE